MVHIKSQLREVGVIPHWTIDCPIVLESSGNRRCMKWEPGWVCVQCFYRKKTEKEILKTKLSLNSAFSHIPQWLGNLSDTRRCAEGAGHAPSSSWRCVNSWFMQSPWLKGSDYMTDVNQIGASTRNSENNTWDKGSSMVHGYFRFQELRCPSQWFFFKSSMKEEMFLQIWESEGGGRKGKRERHQLVAFLTHPV